MLNTGSLCDQSDAACVAEACQDDRRLYHIPYTEKSFLSGSSAHASLPAHMDNNDDMRQAEKQVIQIHSMSRLYRT